jgi:nucleotide-binding universal stress UspA family protein
VIVWPLPFYFSGYVFSLEMYQIWIYIAVSWAIGAAAWIVLLPLIEARHGIYEAVKKISAAISLDSRTDLSSDNADMNLVSKFQDLQGEIKRILVAVDGSVASLRALNYASSMINDSTRARIYILNVIEWTDEDEESIDSLLVSKMEEEGRKMLKSIIITGKKNEYERIVRHGDPATKIAEIAQKLDVEMILMGSKGLGNTEAGIGHVSAKVLRSTTKPVVLLNNV